MQFFAVEALRFGTTIVTQFLNCHDQIKLFDEIDPIGAVRSGGPVTGGLEAFLRDRGLYETYRRCAEKTADPHAALHVLMNEIARPCTIWGEKNPWYAARLHMLTGMFPTPQSCSPCVTPVRSSTRFSCIGTRPPQVTGFLDQGHRGRGAGAAAPFPAAADVRRRCTRGGAL